jgi:hypothetical protein
MRSSDDCEQVQEAVAPCAAAHRYLCFYVSSSGYVALKSKALVCKNIGRMRKEERRSAVRCCPAVSLEGLRKTRVNMIIDVPAAIQTGNSLDKSPNCLY